MINQLPSSRRTNLNLILLYILFLVASCEKEESIKNENAESDSVSGADFDTIGKHSYGVSSWIEREDDANSKLDAIGVLISGDGEGATIGQMRRFFDRIGQEDPSLFKEWYVQNIPTDQLKLRHDMKYRIFLQYFARYDRDGFMEMIVTSPASEMAAFRGDALSMVFSFIKNDSDIVKAKNLLLKNISELSDKEIGIARLGLARSAAAIDPEAALEILREEPANQFIDPLQGLVFSEILKNAKSGKTPLLESLDDLTERESLNLLSFQDNAQLLAELDVSLSEKLLRNVVLTTNNVQVFEDVLRDLVLRDVNRTFDFLSDLPSSKIRNEIINSVSVSLGFNDASNVLSLVENVPEDINESVLRGVAFGQARKDLEGALQVSNELTGRKRQAFLEGALLGHSELDPQRTAEVLGKLVEKDEVAIGVEVFTDVGRVYGQRSPVEAAAWAMKLNGANGLEAMSGVAKGWIDEDITGFANWLESQEKSPAINVAVEQLVLELESSDPQSANYWRVFLERKR
ncbi:hypothetical protein [Roseibacillus ishigakijimensis]|uniref:Uncharacterized protein n=1 Tax=Roseibacillus ishigakijimensis TaxID=454146 RepID=A0A934RU19_9BACT|nr:hypothetical protein [Roseibacillus ishigakijimensis]MBK1835423.1 hypothetical protein [Roseibacillus ishigakijimensis]